MKITSELVHDIRNTVASMKAYIQIIKRRAEKNGLKEETDYLTKLDEKANKLIELITSPDTK